MSLSFLYFLFCFQVHGTLENARLKAAENLRLQQNKQTPGQQQNKQPGKNNQNNTSQVNVTVIP